MEVVFLAFTGLFHRLSPSSEILFPSTFNWRKINILNGHPVPGTMLRPVFNKSCLIFMKIL